MLPPEDPLKTNIASQMNEDDDDDEDPKIIAKHCNQARQGEPCCSKEGKNGSSAADQAVVVDIMTTEENGGGGGGDVCRICHLSDEQSPGRSELIQLGCNCREELGLSHRHCAEEWFQHKGNRVCEICNQTAKNVRLKKDPRIYVMEINEIRPMAISSITSLESSREGSGRCKNFCNFILVCMVFAFLISTFLRFRWF